MLSSLLRWGSPKSTPQDDFKRLQAKLAAPPHFDNAAASPLPSRHAKTETTSCAHIIDPYHFIICQHGVLSTSADFDNVIADLFVHHEVSVLEAVELAEASQSCGNVSPSSFVSATTTRREVAPHADGTAAGPRNGAVLSLTCSVPTSLDTSAPNPSAPFPFTPTDAAVDNGQYAENSASAAPVNPAPRTNDSDPLRPDTALTHEQRVRRDTYKASFQLAIDYPNNTSGRLYRSGNLRVFSPGSNNYLRSDAGTVACARKMLAETVPQLHAWLDDVEAAERQRRARWHVYARVANTPAAARLAEEASAPLPVCLSFMAHSFGGIIERECLYLLLMDTTETRQQNPRLYDAILSLRERLRVLNVSFENFLNIATPHCGAGECLWWPIYFGAWCLARLHLCQTYDELILSDADRVLQTRLLDAAHLKVLELFRRRVLFANTHRDLLVGFGTCSLIFENVDTDHTKFVGVSAEKTHCAAAFADDSIEISKAIHLRSFAEEEAVEQAEAEARLWPSPCGGSTPAAPHAQSTSLGGHGATASAQGPRTHTLRDLDTADAKAGDFLSAKCFTASTYAAADGVITINADTTDESAERSDRDGATEHNSSNNSLSRTLCPQATYSAASGLTVASAATVNADAGVFSSRITMPSGPSAAMVVGHTVPSHDIAEVTLQDVLPFTSWRCEKAFGDQEENDGAEAAAAAKKEKTQTNCSRMLTIVMDPSPNSAKELDDAGCGAGTCGISNSDSSSSSTSITSRPLYSSISPVSVLSRSLSVLRSPASPDGYAGRRALQLTSPVPFGSPRGAAFGSSDSDSATSRRSRGGHVAAVLTDPRWAAEHVRTAASAVQTGVKRRLSAATAKVLGSTDDSDAMVEAASVSKETAALTASAFASSEFPSSSSTYLIPSDDLPQYRKSPRAIAAKLREKLSWRVRAVRFDNLIPVGHVACLGNWAFCGRSPMLVQSVAEELLIIL